MSAIPDPAGSKFLVDESPLIILPSLAAAIGLPEAIMLQQLHYWLRTAGKPHDGRLWIYNSYPQWVVQMPFWTPRIIRRVLTRLQALGLIHTANYNALTIDRTTWYTIDYAVVAALGVLPRALQNGAPSDRNGAPSAQNGAPGDQNGAPGDRNGAPGAQNGAPGAQNGAPGDRNVTWSAQTVAPSDQTVRPWDQNVRPSDQKVRPLPETTTKTTSESNTETPESVCTSARAAIDQFTVTEPLLSWWTRERTAASLGPDAIPLVRETDAWRDYLRREGRQPADLAAHWRQWMRHAIRYYLQRPPAKEPVHGIHVHEYDPAAAEARAAESRAAAAQLMAAVRAIPRPQQAAG